jgi:hypothetical protein
MREERTGGIRRLAVRSGRGTIGNMTIGIPTLRMKSMNEVHYLRSRPWTLAVVVIGFVAGHLILFHVLRHSRVSHVALPTAVVVGLVLLMIAKHVGILAALLRSLHVRLRRRTRS